MKPVSTFKTKDFLRHNTNHAAYEQHLPIMNHYLFGPFNYATPAEVGNQSCRISELTWKALIHVAPQHGVDISNLDKVQPLRASK